LFSGAGTVEDDVYHRPTTQVFGGDFAHRPAHRVNDVGFAAAVGTDYANAVAGKGDAGGIDEGFEAVEFDTSTPLSTSFAEAHGFTGFDERGKFRGSLGIFVNDRVRQ